ncbi:class I SAM-dependent methyltransferase [Patescibacteria group bacterium]|nr:class I SAM-dependent methyltransferase [Patescibacteria group bacterium]
MSQKKDFYSNGKGDRLIDPLFYPKAIRLFLEDEQRLLEQLTESFDLLIEVGCMHGRYLDWAARHGKSYVGIDVVKRYVDAGVKNVGELKLPRDRYRFVLGGAEDIATIIRPSDFGVDPGRCLALFPFNSFGNMPMLRPVIRSLAKSSLPFFISSYRISQKATECRRGYYRNCGYRGIKTLRSRRGVRFTSPDGLSTVAYDPAFLREVFIANNTVAKPVPFSQIGMAYLSAGLLATIKKRKV